MLRLTRPVADAMLAHAVRSAPLEACGLFGGEYGSDHVTRFAPMTNAAPSALVYRLDPVEMLAVEAGLDADGLAVLGVMHSHTHTSPYPSLTDVTDAAQFDPFGTMHFVIVSLKDDEPVLRDYRIADGHVREVSVQVMSER